MNHNLCMLFDKNYLTRGLVTYASLLEHSPGMNVWILCMDEETHEILEKLALQNMKLVRLKDIENEQLLKAKADRSTAEYCWTLSACFTQYVLNNNPDAATVAYLDSDLYFFSSVEPLYKEMGENSIAIIRHNYSERLKYLEKRSGIYNVSLVIFKNDEKGKRALDWWAAQCVEWCYAYNEDDKFGDQMYLDDWPIRFESVHVVKNKGANLAPWNINRYVLKKEADRILVDEDPLIFYHYHSFKDYSDGSHQLHYSSYSISPEDEQLVYPIYVEALHKAHKQVIHAKPDFVQGYTQKPSVIERSKHIVKRLLSRYVVID